MSQSPENEISSEDLLVHGRSKRATAGNRMHFLMQHLDDEDVRNDLLAEDETDLQDYQLSDTEDVAFGSSDESDDANEGQDDDLTGEKELQKQERADARKKKRKAHDFVKVQPMQKRQRIGGTNLLLAPRPRKKSERISWLPTLDDAPTRQSLRRQTVANKEQTEAKLKESQKRSVKAHELLKIAAERKAAAAAPALTQDDRMARALKVEKENSRSLNRWEKAEAERQLAQKLRLEALRDRQLDGPVVRYWSGSVVWEGEKIKTKRVHQPRIEVIEKLVKQKAVTQPTQDATDAQDPSQGAPQAATEASIQATSVGTPSESQPEVKNDAENAATASEEVPNAHQHAETDPGITPKDTVVSTEEANSPAVKAPDDKSKEAVDGQSSTQPDASSQSKQQSFLEGIHLWASNSPEGNAQNGKDAPPAPDDQSQSVQELPAQSGSAPPTPSAPPAPTAQMEQPLASPATNPQPPAPPSQPLSTSTMTTEQPPPQQAALAPEPPTQPQAPPAPLLREQAQRTLIILEAFPTLDLPLPPTTTTKKSTTAATPLTSILLPQSHPSLTAQESKYLTSKSAKKKEFLPPQPPKPICGVTARPARFRDPMTGVGYRDVEGFRMLRRVVEGCVRWSGGLDCWVGGERVAKGVPDVFVTGRVEKKEQDVKKEKDVKGEESAGVTPSEGTPVVATPTAAS